MGLPAGERRAGQGRAGAGGALGRPWLLLPPLAPQVPSGQEEAEELEELLRCLWSPFGEESDSSAEPPGQSSLAEDRSPTPASRLPASGRVEREHNYSLHLTSPDGTRTEPSWEASEGDVAIDLGERGWRRLPSRPSGLSRERT